MYRTITDFINDWKTESEATLQIFEVIEEGKKTEKLNENVRSLERLAWHITQSLTEMPHKAGLIEIDTLDNKSIPSTLIEIISTYKKYSQLLMKAVEDNWTDNDLLTTINMYGEDWTKGKILTVLITHQIHHRAQMTIIMRMLDIKVPGIYGPSKEEWIKYGMASMD
jgi:uncharacterized damage-inducible protein DinB